MINTHKETLNVEIPSQCPSQEQVPTVEGADVAVGEGLVVSLPILM